MSLKMLSTSSIVLFLFVTFSKSEEERNHTLFHPLSHASSSNHSKEMGFSLHNTSSNHTDGSSESHDHHHKGIHLANWRWDVYGIFIIFIGMVITASLLKVLFHHYLFHKLHLPESSLLILAGIIIGAFSHYVINTFPEFTSNLFFNALLPPIILDAAYSLYDRDFFQNLGSILLFAIIGTAINAFVIGFILYPLGIVGTYQTYISSLDCMLFSSLISAVDPVAVLAIFEEIGVNMELYFLVFGESLLNDGVTVVLYNTVAIVQELETLDNIQYLFIILSFILVIVGGFLIGLFCGMITALILKYTSETRVIEPIIVFSIAYLSFILAETIHWSGIISLIGCGISQKRYAFPNISKKSYSAVKYGIKTLSAASDSIIFVFLGEVVFSNQLEFDPAFIVITLILCLFVRFITVYFQCFILNLRRIKSISIKEQFIISYGGLRGAVAFSLSLLINENNSHRNMFITTTLIVIFFTVFIQGATIKLFVEKLNILKKNDSQLSIAEELNLILIDHTMAGVEAIASGLSQHAVLEAFGQFDQRIIRKILIRKGALSKIAIKLEKITLEEHYARLYGPAVLASKDQVGYLIKDSPSVTEFEHSHDNNSEIIEVIDDDKDKNESQLINLIRRQSYRALPRNKDLHQSGVHSVLEKLQERSKQSRRISVHLDLTKSEDDMKLQRMAKSRHMSLATSSPLQRRLRSRRDSADTAMIKERYAMAKEQLKKKNSISMEEEESHM